MATKHDLRDWVLEAPTDLEGSGSVTDVSRVVWEHHEQELRASGDLFHTWQYDIRCWMPLLTDIWLATSPTRSRTPRMDAAHRCWSSPSRPDGLSPAMFEGLTARLRYNVLMGSWSSLVPSRRCSRRLNHQPLPSAARASMKVPPRLTSRSWVQPFMGASPMPSTS